MVSSCFVQAAPLQQQQLHQLPPAFLFPPGALTLNRKSTWNFKSILETFRSLQRPKFSNIFLQFLDLLTGFELKTILPPVAVSVAFLSIALIPIQLYTFNFIEWDQKGALNRFYKVKCTQKRGNLTVMAATVARSGFSYFQPLPFSSPRHIHPSATSLSVTLTWGWGPPPGESTDDTRTFKTLYRRAVMPNFNRPRPVLSLPPLPLSFSSPLFHLLAHNSTDLIPPYPPLSACIKDIYISEEWLENVTTDMRCQIYRFITAWWVITVRYIPRRACWSLLHFPVTLWL